MTSNRILAAKFNPLLPETSCILCDCFILLGAKASACVLIISDDQIWSRPCGRFLTYWGRGKMAAIFQIFSNAFSSVKMLKFQLGFHRNLFLSFQLTVSQHWCRWWLGADQATNHYLNQWWSCLLMHICITRPQWVQNFKVSIVKWWIGTYFVPSHFLKQQWPSLKHTGAFLGGNGLNLDRGSIVMVLRNYSLYWLYWSQLIGYWIKNMWY